MTAATATTTTATGTASFGRFVTHTHTHKQAHTNRHTIAHLLVSLRPACVQQQTLCLGHCLHHRHRVLLLSCLLKLNPSCGRWRPTSRLSAHNYGLCPRSDRYKHTLCITLCCVIVRLTTTLHPLIPPSFSLLSPPPIPSASLPANHVGDVDNDVNLIDGNDDRKALWLRSRSRARPNAFFSSRASRKQAPRQRQSLPGQLHGS